MTYCYPPYFFFFFVSASLIFDFFLTFSTVFLNININIDFNRADVGESEVVVSHDLREYLTTSCIARCSPSRSDSITFVWDRDRDRENTGQGSKGGGGGGGGGDKGIGSREGSSSSSNSNSSSSTSSSSSSSSSEHVIEGISYHSIALSTPYQGPAVKNGLPKVYVRTKLVPLGTFSQAAPHSDQRSVLGYAGAGYVSAMPATHIRESIVRECKMPHRGQGLVQPDGQVDRPPITAMCAHPLLYQVVLGFLDDSLCIFDCASD